MIPQETIGSLLERGVILEQQDGNHGEKHPTTADYVETDGVPFVMARDFPNGTLDLREVTLLRSDVADSLRIGFAQPGDVLLTHKGTVGSTGIVPRGHEYVMLTPQVTYYRTNQSKLLNTYLRCAFRAPGFQQQLASFSAQSTRPFVSISAQRLLKIPVPPISVQVRVAGLLSAYDDLIESCERRIRVLDAMARALHREWFVNFRYPGHEKVPMVDSSLGQIPRGWQVRTAAETLEINPRVALPREGERPFVPMNSLSSDTMTICGVETRSATSGSKFQNGDTLFARITPCLENGKTGFVQFLPDDVSGACGSTEFIVLRGRTVSPEFTYCLSRSDEFRGHAIKSMSGATGRQRVQERCFEQYFLAEPPAATLTRFTDIARPMFKLTERTSLRLDNLRATRDLLLPRLLSGQLSVADLAA